MFDEKNGVQKSLETVPLNGAFISIAYIKYICSSYLDSVKNREKKYIYILIL
jgi:hypothetical protein